MPDITITVSDEVAERLAVLADPPSLAAGAVTLDAASVIAVLIDHVQQGVYRPGAWERRLVCDIFGEEWLSRLEPDTRPEMLSGDGRVIFERPKRTSEVVKDGSEGGEAADG